MLSTAHHILESELDITLVYKSTHKNHPSNIWARSSIDQYEWLWLHTKRMCELYTSHTGRIHASERVLDLLVGYPTGIDDNGFQDAPRAVYDHLKNIEDSCTAYQIYLQEKYTEWLDRDKPLAVLYITPKPSFINL